MITKLVTRILNDLHSESTRDTIDLLDSLLEKLYNKHDPEMSEVQLADKILMLKENIMEIKSNLQSYIINDRKNLPNNKRDDIITRQYNKRWN